MHDLVRTSFSTGNRAAWAGEAVGYGGAHKRHKESLPATCEQCGSAKNVHAALRRDTPLEFLKFSIEAGTFGLRYSTRVEDYRSLCIRCHRDHDLRTHCGHGHLFDAANTYTRPDNGKRTCRACQRRREAQRAA